MELGIWRTPNSCSPSPEGGEAYRALSYRYRSASAGYRLLVGLIRSTSLLVLPGRGPVEHKFPFQLPRFREITKQLISVFFMDSPVRQCVFIPEVGSRGYYYPISEWN